MEYIKNHDFSIPVLDLDAEHEKQIIIDREKGQYLGHPTTVLMDDMQTMYCVYPKGHGKGEIVLKKSTDRGLTWSDRLSTPDNWSTSREVPTIYKLYDQKGTRRLFVFSGLYPIRRAVSGDDGQTWSPLKPIGDFGGMVALSEVVPLKTPGHYMGLFHDDGRFIKGGENEHWGSPAGEVDDFKIYKTVSRDGGLSWEAPEVIVEHKQAHLCEAGAVRSPDGEQIALLMRENSRKFNSFVSFSNDEGETWSAPQQLPAALTGDRHVCCYDAEGRLIVSFRDTAHKSSTRGDFMAWVGEYSDLVKKTEGEYRIRLKKNTKELDSSYPALERLPDNTIIATTYGHWDEGEEPYIISVRFNPKTIEKKMI